MKGMADDEAHPNLALGHSTRTFEELLGLLRGHGALHLVDVRRFPRSPRHPHLDGEAISKRLPREGGIGYRHWESAIKEPQDPRPSPEPVEAPNAHRGHSHG